MAEQPRDPRVQRQLDKARDRYGTVDDAGFTLSKAGTPVPVVEVGWDGTTGRRGRPDPVAFGPSAGEPAVELRCGAQLTQRTCKALLGKVWVPEPETFWITMYLPLDLGRYRLGDAPPDVQTHPLSGWLEQEARPRDRSILVWCPGHGVARVHADFVRLAASSPKQLQQKQRAHVLIDVTQGSVGYSDGKP